MLIQLRGSGQHYAWGSTTAIPDLLGCPPDGRPLAELWFGAHPAAPSRLAPGGALDLREHLDTDSGREQLGEQVLARFGPHLPYLLKLIAPVAPLSLQVHPNLEQARAGFDREEAAGIAREAPERLYPDPNHKPELLYALTEFRALSGFRTPRRALELVNGLDVVLADRLAQILQTDPTAHGVRRAVTMLLTPGEVRAEEVSAVVDACAQRMGTRGASLRIDRTVARLGQAYPGDPGAVVALLMNPVLLQPGEAMFVPAGSPHAYLDGLGVEVMANSNNVLRAGLTPKHIDPEGLLEVLDCVAAPPVRIAPEVVGRTRVFYAPVEDFELSVTTLTDEGWTDFPGHGPRLVLVISGAGRFRTSESETVEAGAGDAFFVPATAEPVRAMGRAEVVQATVP
ncbi:mannose-6-phosphate isomerase, class I [Pseudactinotalea sp. Z1732]|uniref:mannose-6-phosphate isomerase, class I n=1 Tax=Pseudactinotalea sp. Z1732 TaxID=3413026 RepID=UPI003C7E0801